MARACLPSPGPVKHLSDRAAEIAFVAEPATDGKALADAIRSDLAGAEIDVAVLPARNRRKRLLVADMDSTMIGQECIDELADMAGLKPAVARITERAMRGELDFEPALRERVALLAGLDAAAIGRVLDERIEPSPGARILVRTMRRNGAYTALVSGGFTAFTGPVAAMIGFDENTANRLKIRDGVLSGQVEEPVLGRDAKLAALERHAARLGLAREDIMAVGDGANDLGMIEAAGLGIAYRAKPALAARAHARIDHADLTALLFLQGYEDSAFILD